MKIPRMQTYWIAILGVVALPAYAVDGVVLINQSGALAGGITPGDTPGFPVTILLPGSYRLSSNLTVPDANTTAIRIFADDVTIDLNGFSIIGPVTCLGIPVTSCSPAGTGNGIDSFQPQSRISIVNGSIVGMGANGVSLPGTNLRVEKLQAFHNGLTGILMPQRGEGLASDCSAIANGADGISAGTVTGSYAKGNGHKGILSSGVNGTFTDNIVDSNGGNGIEGQGSITGNTVTRNQGDGISAGCPSTIVANLTTGNSGFGVNVSFLGCVLANNVP